MSFLPFGKLAAHRPRTFVPQNLDLGDWPQIAPLFDQLEIRATQAESAVKLERWLLDWSELSAALDEESSRRYIAMTCHTDNADAEQAYLHSSSTSSRNSSRGSSRWSRFTSRIRNLIICPRRATKCSTAT